MVLRINGPILYFDTESVEEHLLAQVEAAPPGLRTVVLDVSFSMRLDVSGGDMLRRLKTQLAARGVSLWLADVHPPARADLVRQGLAEFLVDPVQRLTVSETLARLS